MRNTAEMIAMAVGHPTEQIVVEWRENLHTTDMTLYVRHRPSKTQVVITGCLLRPIEINPDEVGMLYRYVAQPGQTVELTYDIAQKTIQFLKETE